MEQFIYIKDFNDLKHGDYIKVHIITDIHNIDTKITKEGIINILGTTIKNKDINIYIEKRKPLLVDYIPDGILFYS